MKVQCSCGAKYEFAVRPEMRDRPVSFVCPACGLDSSAFVDGLIRRELGQTATPAGVPIPAIQANPALTGVVLPSGPEVEPRVGTRLAPAQSAAAPAGAEPHFCPKHPGEIAVEKCYLCSKPICPKCMELFGYVCSPLCKAKAQSHGIEIPVYAGQKSVVEARRWRKIVWAGTGSGLLVVILLSVWFWYAWFGCLPRPVFSVRFPQPAYAGQSIICGDHEDQIVFLHGGTLARYDLKSGREIWSRQLLDQQKIQSAVDRQLQAAKALVDKATSEAWERIPKMPSADDVTRQMERAAAASLNLQVKGRNVWIEAPDKLLRCDWDTGKTLKEIAVSAGSGDLIHRGDELLVVDATPANSTVTHIDLLSGQTRTQDLSAPDAKLIASNVPNSAVSSAQTEPGGLPTNPLGQDAGKPMDPTKVAAQAQHLSLAQKLALPAVLAANMNQQRALNELDDRGHPAATAPSGPQPESSFSLIPGKDGFVELSVKLLEARVITRSAVKASTGKSALDGDVTAGRSMEMSNDLLNEMQRSNGGDLVQEDHSRYEVTVRRPGSDGVWRGEVIGPPKLYPLDTVNVVAADKLIIVLDKMNRKLWQSALGFNLPDGVDALDEESATYGRGPCVERKDSLYVFDEGVLSAFDLRTGNARWRLPTVGVAGLFFDDQDMLYVNTTTASHESLKYSRQIDLSRKVLSVILKVDSRNGKILWSTQSKGLVNYVHGKFILTAQSYQPTETEDDNQAGMGYQDGPWLRIRRLHPSNGHEVWEYFQDRAPLDIGFDKNRIRLVFKKEVQVLHFPGW